MTPTKQHRLEGLEPDNLLAFLAMLGLLRSLERADELDKEEGRCLPRVAWDLDSPPLRPRLFLAEAATREAVAEHAAKGLEKLAEAHDFGGDKDLAYPRSRCREILAAAAQNADVNQRYRDDLVAALMTDAAIKDEKGEPVQPTPLCLMFGQGHQHFLQRLVEVPKQVVPAAQGKGGRKHPLKASECLAEALYEPWHRTDTSFSFRWDPDEDVRYALMAGDPTDNAYRSGTQHGANRLAAVGLAVLTLVPEIKGGRVRPSVVGGQSGPRGFVFAWPVWRDPATLSSIRSLLTHPGLHTPGALANLGVEQTLYAKRISVGKFMNFTRARTEFDDG